MSKTVLEIIEHTTQLEEKFLPKFAVGTSQHSLLKNRIQSLDTARELIYGEEVPSREEGDFVLVKQQNTALEGEIVVTTIDGSTTIKRIHYDNENKKYVLCPELARCYFLLSLIHGAESELVMEILDKVRG